MANNKDFKVKNGVVANGYLETVGTVTDDGPLGYSLSVASYDDVNFSVATQETAPQGLFFKPDGTKLYISGASGDDVNEYNLSTAWDLSTASYTQNFSVAAQETSPRGLFFKSDGTKMYIAGFFGADIIEYTLSTAWDISTSSYTQNFSVSAQDVNPAGLYFRADGTKMYHTGDNSDAVHEYNLSTAWSVSSASFSQSFSVSPPEGNPQGVFFKSDGTKMQVCGYNGDSVYEYTLSTAWDISTASYFIAFSVASQEITPRDIFFKSDGTKMYILGNSSDKVFQYSTVINSKNVDLSTGTVFDVQVTNPTMIGAINAPDTTDTTLGAIFVTQEGAGSYRLRDDNPLTGEIYLNPLGQTGNYRGLTFKPDGTKMYVCSYSGSPGIHQYSLSSPWNVATAAYESTSPTIVAGPSGLTFKDDGTKVYVSDYSPDMLYEYDLTTAWDVSTLVDNGVTFEPGGQPWHINFKPDGTQMYVSDPSVVKQYSLSTAWDLSTASYTSKSLTVSSIYSSVFNADGTQIFLLASNGLVSKYNLSTAYDVSTASFSGVSAYLFINTGYSASFSLYIKPDGTSAYAVMAQDYVVQYSLKEVFPVLYDGSLGINLRALVLDATDIVTLETSNAGSSYTASRALSGMK